MRTERAGTQWRAEIGKLTSLYSSTRAAGPTWPLARKPNRCIGAQFRLYGAPLGLVDQQVRFNLENHRLPYALADRAPTLGSTQVDVLDADLGIRVGVGAAHAGFDRLLASVARGENGIA